AVLERRVLLEPVDRAAQLLGRRVAVGVDAVGRDDLRDRPLEFLRPAGQHSLGAVGRELAVVALAPDREVLLAADQYELVVAVARPACGVDELRRLAGVENLRERRRAA